MVLSRTYKKLPTVAGSAQEYEVESTFVNTQKVTIEQIDAQIARLQKGIEGHNKQLAELNEIKSKLQAL